MRFTGERMIPEFNKEELIYLEHISRYYFANQFVADKKVLDIACGAGYGSKLMANSGAKKVVGVDISGEAIEYAKQNYDGGNIDFMVGEAENLDFLKDKFDVVVSFETIEHLKNQELFLKNVKNILKENGIFIVSTPNSLTYPKGNEFHLKELSLAEFENLLKKHFKNVKLSYQDNVISSYVYQNGGSDLKSYKSVDLNSNECLYLLAVCGDGEIANFADINTVFNNKELKTLRQIIAEKDKFISNQEQELQNKEKQLQEKERQLQDIYNSWSWKITRLLKFLKKSDKK